MRKLLINSAVGWDFPGGPVVKTLPSNARDTGSIPALGTKTLQEAGCGQILKNNSAVDVSLMAQKTFEVLPFFLLLLLLIFNRV